MPLLRRAFAVATSLPGRLVISSILLALVARSIEWDLLEARLAGAGWGWFALAVLLVVIALLIGALRWHLLLHRAGLHTAPAETLRAYGIGVFSNNFLPTGYGGDAVRAWIVSRSGKPLARALTSVFADRFVALVALFFLGVIGFAFSPVPVPGQLAALFFGAIGVGVVGLLVAIAMLRRRGLGRFLPGAIRPWASEVAETLRIYGRDHRLQAETLALSLAYQVITLTSLWALCEALQLDVSPAVLAIIAPLVLVATLAPITVAGFGVREGAYVVLLGELGISASDATLLSLLSVVVLAIASLPGGVAIVLQHERPHGPDELTDPQATDTPPVA